MIVDRSYIYSPDWIENKKAAINPMNCFFNKCFERAVTYCIKP